MREESPTTACAWAPLAAGVYERCLLRGGRARYLLPGDCLRLGNYCNGARRRRAAAGYLSPPPGIRSGPAVVTGPRGEEAPYGGASPPPPRSGSNYSRAARRGAGGRGSLCLPSGEGSAFPLLCLQPKALRRHPLGRDGELMCV